MKTKNNNNRFIIPEELAFFNKKDEVLIVSAEPPAWAVLNNDAAQILKWLPRGEALSMDKIIDILTEKDIHIDFIEDFIGNLADAYIIHREGEDFIQPNKNLKVNGIYIELTSRCNMGCKHCYVNAGHISEDELTTEEILNLIYQIDPPSDIGFSGGEPLLREDCLKIITTVAQKGYQCALLTNGILITPEIAKILSEYKITVQVSLEGHTAEIHGATRGNDSFDKVVQGIKLLVEAGCYVRASITPTQNNYSKFNDYCDFCKELGVKAIHICTFSPQGRGEVNRDELELSQDQLLEFQKTVERLSQNFDIMGNMPETLDIDRVGYLWDRCPLAGSIHIGYNGSIYPCEIAATKNFVVGNVREISLGQALISEKMLSLKSNSRNRIKSIDECAKCIWRNFCGGGCMVLSYLGSGDFDNVDYMCSLRKIWFPKLLWEKATKRKLD